MSGLKESDVYGGPKREARDLALLGGKAAFPRQLYVGTPNLGDKEELLRSYESALDRKWLSNGGPNVLELEAELADRLKVKHCICLCNGTIALEIAIRAIGMKGEVIVPSFTFVASAHALQWQEITPVFCDIELSTHNIDPERVESLITPRTSGIIGVHCWGRPCRIPELEAIAKKHDLRLIFDAAHALGTTFQGAPIGRFGDAEIFSFHATKVFNTLEGGAVATNDDDLAMRIRLMQNFGFTGYDQVDFIGTNGKMNELSAATGLVNLKSLPGFIAKNRENLLAYQRSLAGIDGISLIDYPDVHDYNYQYVVMEVDEKVCGLSRDELVTVLHLENVLARRYFYPGCHRMFPYQAYFPNAHLLLSNTETVAGRVATLPTGTAVTESEIEAIGDIIRVAVANAPAVHKACTDRQPGFQPARMDEDDPASD